MNLVNIKDIIMKISSVRPDLGPGYEKLLGDKAFYESFWSGVKKDIIREVIAAKKNYNIYIHSFGGYFANKYT